MISKTKLFFVVNLCVVGLVQAKETKVIQPVGKVIKHRPGGIGEGFKDEDGTVCIHRIGSDGAMYQCTSKSGTVLVEGDFSSDTHKTSGNWDDAKQSWKNFKAKCNCEN